MSSNHLVCELADVEERLEGLRTTESHIERWLEEHSQDENSGDWNVILRRLRKRRQILQLVEEALKDESISPREKKLLEVAITQENTANQGIMANPAILMRSPNNLLNER